MDDRRAAGAVLRLVVEARLPEDLAGRRQRRRAIRAEVHVDAIAVDDRRRRRPAVLRVDVAAIGGTLNTSTLTTSLPVATSNASARSEMPRCSTAVVIQTLPSATTGEDQPRPGHRRLPRDVLALAPLSGKPRSLEWPCPPGPRNCGPVLLLRQGYGGQLLRRGCGGQVLLRGCGWRLMRQRGRAGDQADQEHAQHQRGSAVSMHSRLVRRGAVSTRLRHRCRRQRK